MARELGMSPRRFLSEHTSEDITEWQAFGKLEHEEHEKRTRDADAARGAEQRAKKQLRR